MKKQFKKAKGILTRLTALALAVATILSMGAITPLAANAASNWPSLSGSSYATYVAPANVSSLYQNPEMSIRGTASPKKAYQSSISRGDELMLMGFTDNGSGIIVSYPVGQGGRRIAYVPTKTLLGVSNPVEVFKAKASVPVYKITSKVTKWGSVAVNDQLYRCGTTTFDGVKYVLFVYEAVSGERAWKVGFLKMSDYEKVKNGTSTSQASTGSNSAKVSLNVELMKQTDSRWKGTYIGSKTIGNVGCLITDLAMVHSYNTGIKIYPDGMKDELKFDNNDLIWSSVEALGYTHLTYNTGITQGIMAKIYEKLKGGRPVIIGACNSKGSHWVVVTAYTGSSTSSFDPTNFKINDPNANRTTLAAFLSTYSSVRGLVY